MGARRDALAAAVTVVVAERRQVCGDGRPGGRRGREHKRDRRVGAHGRGHEGAVRRLRVAAERAGRVCGVCVEWETMHEVKAMHMGGWVSQAVRGAVGSDAVTSRAGHDAQTMVQVT